MTTKIDKKTEAKKVKSLAKFLKVSKGEIVSNGDYFSCGREDYLVLTDEEADEKTEDYISESVWAFRPSFLLAHLPDGINARSIELIQKDCESANAPLRAMIKDFDYFVEDAVKADGRGHFIAGYDFEENEQDGFYIYRVN